MRILKTWILPIAFVGAIFAIDQFTKWLTVQNMTLGQEIPLIDGVFSLLYIHNHGMAFGLFQGGRWIFIVVTMVILAFLIYYYTTLPKTRTGSALRVLLLILLGGALGNFYDRLLHGYVVDMFFIRLINFPVFNMADIFVVVSVIILAILTIFSKDESPKKLKMPRKK